ncbi:MAG: hypothetical protein WKG07_32640 [Hymenobacter sp.]
MAIDEADGLGGNYTTLLGAGCPGKLSGYFALRPSPDLRRRPGAASIFPAPEAATACFEQSLRRPMMQSRGRNPYPAASEPIPAPPAAPYAVRFATCFRREDAATD